MYLWCLYITYDVGIQFVYLKKVIGHYSSFFYFGKDPLLSFFFPVPRETSYDTYGTIIIFFDIVNPDNHLLRSKKKNQFSVG